MINNNKKVFRQISSTWASSAALNLLDLLFPSPRPRKQKLEQKVTREPLRPREVALTTLTDTRNSKPVSGGGPPQDVSFFFDLCSIF